MAKFILIAVLFQFSVAHADLFDFGSDKSSRDSKIPVLIEKLRSMEMKDEAAFEDRFNQAIKAIENSVEQEKLFCTGELTDNTGKILPASQKQLCMRDLKKNYVEATETIFEIKKKYLGFIHQKQLQNLTEIQKKLKSDIEKNL